MLSTLARGTNSVSLGHMLITLPSVAMVISALPVVSYLRRMLV
jgi:hypothetical protein